MGLYGDSWGERLEKIHQDIYDLMATEKIRITIEGETGSVDGTLYIIDPSDGQWMMIASSIGDETDEECLAALVRQAQRPR